MSEKTQVPVQDKRRAENDQEVATRDRLRQDALETSLRTKALLDERRGAPAPPVRPAATFILLLTGVWLFAATFALDYPYDSVGQLDALREIGFAIPVLLVAIWLRQVGPSRVASGIGVFVGILMLLSAFFLPHDNLRFLLQDAIFGSVVILASLFSNVRE